MCDIAGSAYRWASGRSCVYHCHHGKIPEIIESGFGPRKVMAGLLVIGAIPSGLAGTVTTPGGLYVIRFFIGTPDDRHARRTASQLDTDTR